MNALRCVLFIGCSLLALPRAGSAAIVVLSSLAHEHTLAPGETFDGAIFLRNSGREPATARVSQTDYRFAADGSNDFGPPGVAPRSNARWLAPATTLVTLPPGEVVALRYKGQAPADAALVGSYWSVIMIEDTATIAGPNGIATVTRYGIQVVTQIGAGGTRSVRFLQRESQRRDETATLLLDLENDGERLVFPKLWVEVFDASGRRLGRFGGTALRLYPACSARYQIALPAIPAGRYQALILADCGDDQMVGTKCELAL